MAEALSDPVQAEEIMQKMIQARTQEARRANVAPATEREFSEKCGHSSRIVAAISERSKAANADSDA